MMQYSIAFLLSASAATAHYTIPSIAGQAEWAAVRRVNDYQSSAPVTDVTSDTLRCNQQDPASATADVVAGDSVTISFSEAVYHPGPVQSYLAKVPDGQDINTWDPTDAVWFKIHQDVPDGLGGDELKWPAVGNENMNIAIPSCIPAGDYLMRNEQVALQLASTPSGAQFFLSCAQIKVGGGGSTLPTDGLVAFPGAYSAEDPGILINVNNPVPTSYTNPGPAVFACA